MGLYCAVEFNSSSLSLLVLDKSLAPLGAGKIKFDFNIEGVDLSDEIFVSGIDNKIKEILGGKDLKIKEINFCLSHSDVEVINVQFQSVLSPYGKKEVTKREINKLLEQSRLLKLDWNKELLHSFVFGFNLDGKTFSYAPIGVAGKRITLEVSFVVAEAKTIKSLKKLSESLGLRLGNVLFYPLGVFSLFPLSTSWQNVFFIRFRRYRTEITAFVNSFPAYAASIPIGGDYIDKEISRAFGISDALSEELKINYGSLKYDAREDKKDILLKRSNLLRNIERGKLNQVLYSAYDNLLSALKRKIPRDISSRISSFFSQGLTSSVENFEPFAEEKLSLGLFKQKCLLPPGESVFEDCFWGSFGSFHFKHRFKNRFIFDKTRFWDRIVELWEDYF